MHLDEHQEIYVVFADSETCTEKGKQLATVFTDSETAHNYAQYMLRFHSSVLVYDLLTVGRTVYNANRR